jgi:hypothetical protein
MLAVRGALQGKRTMTARDVAKSFAGRADKDRAEAITEVLIALRALGQAGQVPNLLFPNQVGGPSFVA